MNFKYGDRVEIISSIHRSQIGKITGYTHTGKKKKLHYTVEFTFLSNIEGVSSYSFYFPEEDLKLHIPWWRFWK